MTNRGPTRCAQRVGRKLRTRHRPAAAGRSTLEPSAMSKGSSSENPRSTWNFLWRGKTDLDRLIWLLSIDDHGLVWLHIYELIFDLLDRFQGKFLIFSHS